MVFVKQIGYEDTKKGHGDHSKFKFSNKEKFRSFLEDMGLLILTATQSLLQRPCQLILVVRKQLLLAVFLIECLAWILRDKSQDQNECVLCTVYI